MTNSTLPEELLTLTFDLLSQTDLYHSALVSKTFLAIVKPLLYSCIVIKTTSQTRKLEDADEKDKSRIESVNLLGESIVARGVHFDNLSKMFTNQGADALDDTKEGCVQKLFGGAILPLDHLKYVSIRNAVENPEVIWSTFPPVLNVAANLVQLSVANHRGGYHYWHNILARRNVPSLRRLHLCQVTHFEPRFPRPVVDPQCPFLVVNSSDGIPLAKMHPAEECSAIAWLLEQTDLLDQLELLVSEDNDRLEEILSLVHLTLLRLTDNVLLTTSEVLPSSKYVQVHFGGDPSEIDRVFESISDLLDSNESQLEYLCFPSPFTLTASQSDIIDHLIEQQVEVVYDGHSQGSFVPPSFTDYLEKKETEKVVVEVSS
ncbi:hypothetical protein JCM5353_004777 [Sporobolomyces roseus]